jgi:hypothetical protein
LNETPGILSFIAKMVSSLVWPITTIACVLLLRRYLTALIPLLRTVKYSDVEIRFGKEVAELAKSTELSSLSKGHILPPAQQAPSDLTKMAEVRPRTAIRMAFRNVEQAILEVAHRRNIEVTDAATGMPMVVGSILLNQGVMSNDQYELLTKLRILVNDAEHSPPDVIKPESAAEFIALATNLADSIAQ